MGLFRRRFTREFKLAARADADRILGIGTLGPQMVFCEAEPERLAVFLAERVGKETRRPQATIWSGVSSLNACARAALQNKRKLVPLTGSYSRGVGKAVVLDTKLGLDTKTCELGRLEFRLRRSRKINRRRRTVAGNSRPFGLIANRGNDHESRHNQTFVPSV